MNRVCPGQGETWSPQCPALEIFYLCKLHLGYLLFSHPVMSNSLQPHGLQHTRPPFPSPSPGVCRSLCSLHLWCCPDIWSSDCSLLLLPSIFPSISLHQIPLQGSLPCRFQGAWVTQWSYEPCYVGLPKTMGHNREFWQNVIHWRREWQTTPVYLLWELHKLYKRTKRHDTERWVPHVWRCPTCYWGRAENY